MGLSRRNAEEAARRALAHGLEEFRVNVLREGDRFLCNRRLVVECPLTSHCAVLNAQQLGLMVAGNRGIGVGVPREEGQLLREVSRLHDFEID